MIKLSNWSLTRAAAGVTTILASAVVVAGAAALPASAAGNTVHMSVVASTSPDSGTCGNNWANDTFDRDFKIDTSPNADGTYNVTESFKNGTFVTVAGSSPGACENGPNNGNTVGGGITGTMQGTFSVVVSNGTYDPTAVCTPVNCNTTAGFVSTVFGPGATYDVPSFDIHYNAKSHGDWKNASADKGGNTGDITGN